MTQKPNYKSKRDKNLTKSKLWPKRYFIVIPGLVLVIAAVVGIMIYKFNATATPLSVESAYSISGTIGYNGSRQSGRVYIEVTDSSGGYSGLGTSIASPGSYIIHNVPTGAYLVNAWMDVDNPQIGVPNALSPTGSIPVNVNDGNVSGQNISILDPATKPAPGAPISVGVAPANGSALVQWNAPQDAGGNVLAQSYNIYYGTSSTVSPQTGVKKTAQANNSLFITGLTDGTTYYFVVTAVLGGVESSASSPAASVTVGATTGSNTISGAISFPIMATGPMYVGLSNQNGTFFQYISKPVNPQSYSVSGVPNGDYAVFAIIDMNNNGSIETGDLNKTNNAPSSGNTVISINSDMKGVNQTLLSTNVLARVVTIHSVSTSSPDKDVYSLEFELGGNLKLPVNVKLSSGLKTSVPTDLVGFYNYFHLFQTLDVKPKVKDSYIFSIEYSDGTFEKVNVSVTAVLESFAQNLTTSGTERSKPTFSWTAPASEPADYTYLIQLGQYNIGREWTYPTTGNGMPSSQTSVLYNVDGSSSLTTLQAGTPYNWLIFVIDSNGNQAVSSATYTP